jgi:hypothetical protein
MAIQLRVSVACREGLHGVLMMYEGFGVIDVWFLFRDLLMTYDIVDVYRARAYIQYMYIPRRASNPFRYKLYKYSTLHHSTS